MLPSSSRLEYILGSDGISVLCYTDGNITPCPVEMLAALSTLYERKLRDGYLALFY